MILGFFEGFQSIAKILIKNFPKSFSFPENIARNGVGRVIQEETPCWPEGEKRLVVMFSVRLKKSEYFLDWPRTPLLAWFARTRLVD